MSAQPEENEEGAEVVRLIPRFEGEDVVAIDYQISGLSVVQDSELELASIDDRVRLVGQFRVIAVRHVQDPKTGDIRRIQVLKPISIEMCPWDPADPKDRGVLHVRGDV